MGDVIEIDDEVRLLDGTMGRILAIEHFVGLYVLSVDGAAVVRQRHEFVPAKWSLDVIGNTGISVCAQNGSEAVL